MNYNFDAKIDRKGTLSVKWNEKAIASICGNPDAEPFWVADMDFTASPEIQREVTKAAQKGIYGYPHFDGNREVFCSWAKLRHNWEVEPSEVIICQGLLTSLAMLTETLTNEGEGVIIPMPAYQPFVRIVNNLKRKLVRWPLLFSETTHTFSLDWETFEKLCENTKLLIFCSPHNPTGLEFSIEELTKLCLIAKKHEVTILCDEIHGDLSFGTHTPLLSIARKTGTRCATCMAPSKTFNIAGEHFSVVVTDDIPIKEALCGRMSQLFVSETSFFSTTAAITAYKEGFPWLMQLLPYLKGNIDLIDSYFKAHIPSLTFIRPDASFIGLIDCQGILPKVERDAVMNPELYDSRLSPNGGLLSRFFGQRAKVAVNDGTWFGGDEYRQFVRFNYGVRRENIKVALQRIEMAVSNLN
ncbi:MAG: aminotransferase class I/II-fold pyridoxal phosphate-dependent enzyme [Sphaerochaetaceae bacterium]